MKGHETATETSTLDLAAWARRQGVPEACVTAVWDALRRHDARLSLSEASLLLECSEGHVRDLAAARGWFTSDPDETHGQPRAVRLTPRRVEELAAARRAGLRREGAPPSASPVVSQGQAARLLGVTRTRIQQLCRAGRLERVPGGGVSAPSLLVELTKRQLATAN